LRRALKVDVVDQLRLDSVSVEGKRLLLEVYRMKLWRGKE